MSFGDVLRYASPITQAIGIGGNASVIWLCGILASTLVYELNVSDLSVDRYASPPSTNPWGIGGDENTIWHADHRLNKVYELSTIDFSVVRFADSPDTETHDIGGTSSKIWLNCKHTFYELSTADFSVITSATSPDADPPSGVMGFGAGGDSATVYHSNAAVDLVYELSSSNFSVIRSASSPSLTPAGIGGDVGTIWHADTLTGRVYELDAFGGGTLATIGKLWVENEELHMGDGEGWERYFVGFDTGGSGTAGEIGYSGSVLRYVSKTGKLRAINLEDMGLNITAGQLGYESGGKRLRHGDASGYKRQKQGMLV